MCGIAGIVPFNQDNDKKDIENMVDEIIHRGPDQRTTFQNNIGIFGFVRLKIIYCSQMLLMNKNFFRYFKTYFLHSFER